MTPAPRPRPEKTFGPFPGGLRLDVWRNTRKVGDMSKQVRSLTISPQRYQDKDGQWKDSKSYSAADVRMLIFALPEVLRFIEDLPLATVESPTQLTGSSKPYAEGFAEGDGRSQS